MNMNTITCIRCSSSTQVHRCGTRRTSWSGGIFQNWNFQEHFISKSIGLLTLLEIIIRGKRFYTLFYLNYLFHVISKLPLMKEKEGLWQTPPPHTIDARQVLIESAWSKRRKKNWNLLFLHTYSIKILKKDQLN